MYGVRYKFSLSRNRNNNIFSDFLTLPAPATKNPHDLLCRCEKRKGERKILCDIEMRNPCPTRGARGLFITRDVSECKRGPIAAAESLFNTQHLGTRGRYSHPSYI